MGMKMPEGVNPNIQSMQGGVVETFFASLLDSETPMLKKYRVYDLYNKAKEDEKIRNEFEKEANFMSNIRWFAHVINKDFAIIESIDAEDNNNFKWMLRASIGKKFNICNSVYNTFDKALLAGICYKYTGLENNYLIEMALGMMPNNYEINKMKGLV